MKRNKPYGECISIYNTVHTTWKSSTHGRSNKFHSIEKHDNNHMTLLLDRRNCILLENARSILLQILKEKDPHEEIWECMKQFMDLLHDNNFIRKAALYVLLEAEILKFIGFGLTLNKCAVTGQQHDLVYVSPKSGNAISSDIGKPYHDKLLPLPHFLQTAHCDMNTCTPDDVHNGLKLMTFFLNKHCFIHLTPARQQLINTVISIRATDT